MKKSDRRWRPAVNLAPCSCAAAVVYRSTLHCCAHCKTRHCLTDASTEANKRFVYVTKTYLICYNKIVSPSDLEKFSQKLGQYQKLPQCNVAQIGRFFNRADSKSQQKRVQKISKKLFNAHKQGNQRIRRLIAGEIGLVGRGRRC